MNNKLNYFNSLITYAYREKGGDLIYYKDQSYNYVDVKELLKFYTKRFEDKNNNEDNLEIRLTEKALQFVKDKKDELQLERKAKSWLGRQRKLKREGKLELNRIDELNKFFLVQQFFLI